MTAPTSGTSVSTPLDFTTSNTTPQPRPEISKRGERSLCTKKRRGSKLDPLQLLTFVVTSPASAAAAARGKTVGGKQICTFCASTFGRRCELKRHISEVHSAGGARRFRCTVHGCEKSFTRRDALVKHHTVKHQGKRRFICPKCSEKFTSRYDLSRHSIRVHSNVKKRFTCEFCAAGFSQKSQLTMHKGRVHATGKQTQSDNVSTASAISTYSSMPSSSIDSLAAVAAAAALADQAACRIAARPMSTSEAEAAAMAADTLLEAAAVLQPISSGDNKHDQDTERHCTNQAGSGTHFSLTDCDTRTEITASTFSADAIVEDSPSCDSRQF